MPSRIKAGDRFEKKKGVGRPAPIKQNQNSGTGSMSRDRFDAATSFKKGSGIAGKGQ